MADPFTPLRLQGPLYQRPDSKPIAPNNQTGASTSLHRRRSTLMRQGVFPSDRASLLKRRLSGLNPTAQLSCTARTMRGLTPAPKTSKLGYLKAAGQHVIICNEQGARAPFLCLLDDQVSRHQNPFYDIELDLKWSKPAFSSFPTVVFGFTSPSENYYSIRGEYKSKTWSIRQHVATGAENDFKHRVNLLQCASHKIPDPGRSAKHPNIFRQMFLQIRGASFSLDVDGYPIFTSLTLPIADNVTLGTRVGISCAPGSSWIFRNLSVSPQVVLTGKHSEQEPSTLNIDLPQDQHRRLPSAPAISQRAFTLPVPIASLGEPHLVRMIEQDMLETQNGKSLVSFQDIAGLATAKRLLHEAVVLPVLAPEVFVGIRESWKGILLYGPPGTGKTMLAKATAASSGITFINASAATLVSKYRGESEKLVRVLFSVARSRAPSCIFLDEIDALATRRGGATEHEASRRLKSQLLTCMDGITSTKEDRVVVLATTNTPWDLDDALLRRLEKRIFVPLPDTDARKQLFSLLFRDLKLGPDIISIDPIVKRTEGFSCADIRMIVREAGMGPVRRMLGGKSAEEISLLRKNGDLTNPGPVLLKDIVRALKSISPSVGTKASTRFHCWGQQFASQ